MAIKFLRYHPRKVRRNVTSRLVTRDPSSLAKRYFYSLDKSIGRRREQAKKFFMHSPSYDDELYEEIHTNPKWAVLRPSRRHGPYGRTSTGLYEAELKQAAKKHSWMLWLIEGAMGSGKSYLAYSIALDLQSLILKNFGNKVEIRFWRSKSDFLDAMQFGKLHPGDINIIDEFGDMSGTGSATEDKVLMNVIKMTREAGLLRTIIICPDFGDSRRRKFAKVCTGILKMAGNLSYREYCPNCKEETIFWHERCLECQQRHPTKADEWERNRVTRTIHFKTNTKPRGFTYHPIPTDAVMEAMGYRDFKTSHTMETIKNRGIVFRKMDQERREYYARRFIEEVTSDPYWDPERDINRTTLRSFKDYIPLHGTAQDAIIEYAYRILRKEYCPRGDDMLPEVVKPVPENFEPETDFKTFFMKNFRFPARRGMKPPSHKQVMELFFAGKTQKEIADIYNVNVTTVSGRISECKIQAMFEHYWRAQMGDKRKLRGTAPHDEPDCVDRNGEAHTIKTYTKSNYKTITLYPQTDFKPELEWAIKHGQDRFHIAIYIMGKPRVYTETFIIGIHTHLTVSPKKESPLHLHLSK